MEYNSDRNHLKLREYGRNVQELVAFIKTIDDKEKRNSYAATLVELMKQINPNVKDSQEYNQKVWDDLFIISGFDLDVESPFPIPESEILDRKPDRVNYLSNEIKFKHYGRNIEIMIKQAIELEDPDEKEGAVVSIGRLMKSFFLTWNKDHIEDEVVLSHIKNMSGHKLDIDLEKVKEYKLFDSTKKERPDRGDRGDRQNGGGRNYRKGGGKRSNNKRRRPNY